MIGLPPSPFLSDIQSSPAPDISSLNAGESEPVVMPAFGAGETQFVLDEAAFVAALSADDLPSFLTAPRAEYLGMIERGAE